MRRLLITLSLLGMAGHCLSAEVPFGLGGTDLRSEPDGQAIGFRDLSEEAQAILSWADQFDFPYRNTRHIPISSIVGYVDRVTHIGPHGRLDLTMRFDELIPTWGESFDISDEPLRMGLPQNRTVLRMWLIMAHVLKGKVGITETGHLFLFSSSSQHGDYVPVASLTIGSGSKESQREQLPEEEEGELNDRQPVEVSWATARRFILEGDIAEVFQTHSRHVTLRSKRGVVYHTVEPRLDLVLHVIKQVDPQGLFINVGME